MFVMGEKLKESGSILFQIVWRNFEINFPTLR
ncbi:hypothetical protein BDFB_015332 [Asbolus verrucosus]|uniref:Uncharacterized protein n=1 Tax=Asbolus verrucosus TaxID=1661398 RepID=A0A482VQ80_ASBVE|nr:hypothetical protein BDFB_015332 [Asbolus verrucosus]